MHNGGGKYILCTGDFMKKVPSDTVHFIKPNRNQCLLIDIRQLHVDQRPPLQRSGHTQVPRTGKSTIYLYYYVNKIVRLHGTI